MQKAAVFVLVLLCAWSSAGAMEFLGAEICDGHTRASVVLPEDSPLKIESVEVGQQGALVLLLKGKKGAVLGDVDDLVAGQIGVRGVGSEQELQWSTDTVTAFANVIKRGYVALAVSSSDPCVDGEAPAEGAAVDTDAVSDDSVEPMATAAPVVALGLVDRGDEPAEFALKGTLKHRAEEDDWVDVMGVVVNAGDRSFKHTTFDLSFYDADGALICVDSISVTQLRAGQERAFRDWMRCADYRETSVATTKLQFAGGY